jgi:predicted nucleic acid-binding protein
VSWIVDTSVLIDVLDADPTYGRASAQVLKRKLPEGLTICPVTYVELAPAFEGSVALQEEFLAGVGVDWRQSWGWQDTAIAYGAWARHIARRRKRVESKRPIADVLIGAFAQRHDGLITRNAQDFRALFPELELLDPSA